MAFRERARHPTRSPDRMGEADFKAARAFGSLHPIPLRVMDGSDSLRSRGNTGSPGRSHGNSANLPRCFPRVMSGKLVCKKPLQHRANLALSHWGLLCRRKREHGCDLVHILVPRKMIMCADLQFSSNGQIMPALFDHLYREYCRARLAEMRKQLLISAKRHEVPEAICDARDQSDGLTELNSDRPDPPQAR